MKVILCVCALLLAGSGVSWLTAGEPHPQKGAAKSIAGDEMVNSNPLLVPTLLEISTESERAESIDDVILSLGAAAVPPLVAALDHENPKVRRKATELLALLSAFPGYSAEIAIPALIKMARDEPDDEIRDNAARALCHAVRAVANDDYRKHAESVMTERLTTFDE